MVVRAISQYIKGCPTIHAVDVHSKRYDVYTFEELPLYMKMEVISNHEIIFARDVPELYEYFYFFRKLWKEQEIRQNVSVAEMVGVVGR